MGNRLEKPDTYRNECNQRNEIDQSCRSKTFCHLCDLHRAAKRAGASLPANRVDRRTETATAMIRHVRSNPMPSASNNPALTICKSSRFFRADNTQSADTFLSVSSGVATKFMSFPPRSTAMSMGDRALSFNGHAEILEAFDGVP